MYFILVVGKLFDRTLAKISGREILLLFERSLLHIYPEKHPKEYDFLYIPTYLFGFSVEIESHRTNRTKDLINLIL